MLKVKRCIGAVGVAVSIACFNPIDLANAQNAVGAPAPQAPPSPQGATVWQMVPAASAANSADQSVWLYNTQTGQAYECRDTTAGARCFPALVMPQTQNSN